MSPGVREVSPGQAEEFGGQRWNRPFSFLPSSMGRREASDGINGTGSYPEISLLDTKWNWWPAFTGARVRRKHVEGYYQTAMPCRSHLRCIPSEMTMVKNKSIRCIYARYNAYDVRRGKPILNGRATRMDASAIHEKRGCLSEDSIISRGFADLSFWLYMRFTYNCSMPRSTICICSFVPRQLLP